MACGCSAACACSFAAGPGIIVTGQGSNLSPVVVELDLSSPAACESVVTCAAGHLGPGLRYDAAAKQIAVKVSAQAGNTVTATSGGVAATGCVGCGSVIRVDMLPPSGVCFGYRGIGPTNAPEATREEHSLAHANAGKGIMYHMPCRQFRGDKSWWILPEFEVFDGWNRTVVPPGQNPISYANNYGNQFNLVRYDPQGTYTFGTDGAVNGSQGTLPYCGARHTMPLSAYEALKTLGGQAVMVLRVDDGISFDFPPPDGNPARVSFANTMLKMVDRLGLKQSVIYREYADYKSHLVAWAAQGGISMIHLKTMDQIDDNPADQLVADGITWVDIVDSVHDGGFPGTATKVPDAVIQSYIDVGLNVLLNANITRNFVNVSNITAKRALALGCRGMAEVWDCVYEMGPFTDYDYRHTTAPFANNRRAPGMISQSNFGTDVDCVYSGTYFTDGNPVIPPTNGGVDVWFCHTRDMPTRVIQRTLQGWGCPIANPVNYTISGIMWANYGSKPGPPGFAAFASGERARQMMGIEFACGSDLGPDGGYRMEQWGDSTLRLIKLPRFSQNGEDPGPEVELGRTTLDGFGFFEFQFLISVTSTTVQVSMGRATLSATIGPLAEATYQGEYFSVVSRHTEADDEGAWDAMFRRIVVTPG